MKNSLKKSLALALVLALLPLLMQAKAEYSPKFLCGVVKADSWTTGNNLEGIYSLELTDGGQLTKLTEGRDVLQAPLGGAVYEDGMMKGIHFKQVNDPYDGITYYIYHVQYDMETWTQQKAKWLSSTYANLISSCGMAHDPITGLNYGIFYNFNMSFEVLGRRLATIDFSTDTPKKTIIGDVMTQFAAIAFSSNGLLYGVDMDGYLYIINKEPADNSLVELFPLGDLGIENISTYPASMTFDKKTGKFYLSVVLTDMKSYLYEINPTVGSVSATQIMQLPDNAYLVNLFIPDAQADDEAPAAVTNLQLNFEGASTTGTVSFTAPTTTYTGDPLTGTLDYTVTANGNVVAQGTVEAGAEAEAQVTVPAGDTEFVVIVSNEAGDSPEAKASLYVGPETPVAPANVAFDYNYGSKTATVTWTAPTTGVHEQEIDPEQLTYNIYLMPGHTLAAEGITETTFEQPLDPQELAPYYYQVVAINQGMASEPGVSNNAVIGPALEVPYVQGFNTAESFDLLTVLDNNHDGNSWKWEKSFGGDTRAYYYPSATADADDWLISPPIHLKKGAIYSIEFNANTAVANNVDYMDVAYGQGLNVNDYVKIFDHIVLNTPVSETYTNNEIECDEEGVYYFGFHCTTPASYGWLLLHDFSITLVKDAPAIRGDVNGDGKVNVSDVSALINMILGVTAMDQARADVNGDGRVNVSDVAALINIILGC